MQGGRIMTAIHDRIKNYRNRLHLSQEYVAKFLGINRASYTQMENGKRKVTALNRPQLVDDLRISQISGNFDKIFSIPWGHQRYIMDRCEGDFRARDRIFIRR